MLFLTRRPRQAVVITCPDGTELQILVQHVEGNQVRIGIEAPRSYTIDRYEVHHRKQREASGEVLEGQEPRGPFWVDFRSRQE